MPVDALHIAHRCSPLAHRSGHRCSSLAHRVRALGAVGNAVREKVGILNLEAVG